MAKSKATSIRTAMPTPKAADASTNMWAELVMVTPELATLWLTANANIRNPTKQWIIYFITLLQRGEMELHPLGCAFDQNGRLVDGQHRLMAIAQSKIATRMWVWHDLTDDQVAALDMNRRRKIADALRQDARIVEAMNLAMRITLAQTQITPGQIDDALSSPIGDAAKDLVDAYGGHSKYFSRAHVKVAAIVHLMTGDERDREYVLRTYRGLCTADVDTLPPIGRAWVQQVWKSKSHNDGGDILARGLSVFERKKANLSRVQIMDATTAFGIVREVFRPHVIDNSAG